MKKPEFFHERCEVFWVLLQERIYLQKLSTELPGIATYYPRSPLLKKHVQYYYFMQSANSSFNTAYFVFPNTNISLNIHKNVSFSFRDNKVEVSGRNKNNAVAILMGMREMPVLVKLKGKLDKLTVVFNPLGLNHFLNDPYLTIAAKEAQLFNSWHPGYKSLIQQIYQTDDHDQRINLLERFLLSVYRPIKEYDQLKKSIELLSNFNDEKTIAEISKIVNLPERTFSRAFHREVGISPVRFKKIARFRHSLQNKLFNEQFKRLTQIGHASNFYDQAYFINIYKQLTRQNPAAFFRSIDKLADDNLILSFVKAG
jgi:AraC-like DNA-binding protein